MTSCPELVAPAAYDQPPDVRPEMARRPVMSSTSPEKRPPAETRRICPQCRVSPSASVVGGAPRSRKVPSSHTTGKRFSFASCSAAMHQPPTSPLLAIPAENALGQVGGAGSVCWPPAAVQVQGTPGGSEPEPERSQPVIAPLSFTATGPGGEVPKNSHPKADAGNPAQRSATNATAAASTRRMAQSTPGPRLLVKERRRRRRARRAPRRRGGPSAPVQSAGVERTPRSRACAVASSRRCGVARVSAPSSSARGWISHAAAAISTFSSSASARPPAYAWRNAASANATVLPPPFAYVAARMRERRSRTGTASGQRTGWQPGAAARRSTSSR